MSRVIMIALVYNRTMKKENKTFTDDLLAWYDLHARILPWRQEATPYRVWVSEIMLQQTRVEAVKPYFERFISELPELSALAQASDDQLHKLWEGLGYYNRVKNMKKAAILCMQHYDGQMPGTYEELLKLPGIGSYTAGAVASIAYQQVVPAVDGNVLRVFSRIVASYDDILKESTKKKFQTIIMDYLSEERPDAFNQALMEIGALICVPNAAPKCTQCPINKHCQAWEKQLTQELPVKATKKKRTIEQKIIDVIVCEQEVLLHQRTQGLLTGLYEFSTFENEMEEQAFLQNYKIRQTIPLRASKHIFTHKEWHMSGNLILVKEKQPGIWANKEALLHEYAIPTAFKAYKEALLQWLI